MSVLDRFRLTGKVALVTGGAGLYGRQIVRSLAEAGATVVTASRDQERLQALVGEMAREGMKVSAESLDQADERSVLRVRENLIARHGRVDILVNNAVARPMHDWNSPAEDF